MAVCARVRDDLQPDRRRTRSEKTISNLSTDPMPISIGYHTFYQLPGVPRDEWSAHFPARMHVVADEHKFSTGELRPTGLPDPLPLRGPALTDAFTSQDAWRTGKPWSGLDDGFTDFERDADGRAHFWIDRVTKRWKQSLGPNTKSLLFGCRRLSTTLPWNH